MASEDEEGEYDQESFDPEEAYEVIDDDLEDESESTSESESGYVEAELPAAIALNPIRSPPLSDDFGNHVEPEIVLEPDGNDFASPSPESSEAYSSAVGKPGEAAGASGSGSYSYVKSADGSARSSARGSAHSGAAVSDAKDAIARSAPGAAVSPPVSTPRSSGSHEEKYVDHSKVDDREPADSDAVDTGPVLSKVFHSEAVHGNALHGEMAHSDGVGEEAALGEQAAVMDAEGANSNRGSRQHSGSSRRTGRVGSGRRGRMDGGAAADLDAFRKEHFQPQRPPSEHQEHFQPQSPPSEHQEAEPHSEHVEMEVMDGVNSTHGSSPECHSGPDKPNEGHWRPGSGRNIGRMDHTAATDLDAFRREHLPPPVAEPPEAFCHTQARGSVPAARAHSDSLDEEAAEIAEMPMMAVQSEPAPAIAHSDSSGAEPGHSSDVPPLPPAPADKAAAAEAPGQLADSLKSLPEQVASRLEQDVTARDAADTAIEAALIEVEPGSPGSEDPGLASPDVNEDGPEFEVAKDAENLLAPEAGTATSQEDSQHRPSVVVGSAVTRRLIYTRAAQAAAAVEAADSGDAEADALAASAAVASADATAAAPATHSIEADVNASSGKSSKVASRRTSREEYVETLRGRFEVAEEQVPAGHQADTAVDEDLEEIAIADAQDDATPSKSLARTKSFASTGVVQKEPSREPSESAGSGENGTNVTEEYAPNKQDSFGPLSQAWLSDVFKEGVPIRRRDSFEGKKLSPRSQMQKERMGRRKSLIQTEAEQFLSHLRKKGDGSVGIAWRRFFDTDGDGALSFKEFCHALVAVEYHGDAVALWRQFGGGENSTLGLEVLDQDSAVIMEFFRAWCVRTKGGPLEMFYAFDDDGSDCLQPNELADGLRESGFFQEPGLPECINSEEKMLRVLYPLLDRNGRGGLQPDELLFLELDPDKKRRHERAIQRRREGIMAFQEEVPNAAIEFLKGIAEETTGTGKRHWKMVKHPLLGGDLPTKSSSSKRSASKGSATFGSRSASAASASRSLSATSGSTRKRTPRFLRDFREAKRAAQSGALHSPTGVPPPTPGSGRDGPQDQCDGRPAALAGGGLRSTSVSSGGVLDLREGWLQASTQAEARRATHGGALHDRPGVPHQDRLDGRTRSAPAGLGSPGILDMREGWLPASAQAEQGVAGPEALAGSVHTAGTPSKHQSDKSSPVMAWVGSLPLRRGPKTNNAAWRQSVESQKSRQRHKTYGQGLAPPMQEPQYLRPGRNSPSSMLPGRRSVTHCSSEVMPSFNPSRLDHFLINTKSRSLCEHYGVWPAAQGVGMVHS